MNSFINTMHSKYTMVIVGLAVLVSAFTAGAVPAFSASCPGTVPTSPIFDYWPLTFDSSQTCHDLPLIDARDLSASSGSRDNRYSASQGEHDAGINAQVGDQVRVSIYFHNGATDEASYRSQTTATNVEVGSTFDTSAQTTHTIVGSLSADNAATVTSHSSANQGGDITIHTPTATSLQYVPGTTQMCIQYAAAQQRGADMSQTCGTDASGQPKILINLPDGIANGQVSIGDLESCFPYSGEVVYTVNVVGSQVVNQPGQLSITKQVEDITTNGNGNYSSSTSTNAGDTVQYKVTVTNTGSSTLNNVVVTDPGTSGTQFTSNTSPTTSVGTLAAGQSQTLYYNAQVIASSGTYTNTATASASNASSVSASASIYVNQNITPIYPVYPVYPTYGQLSITKNVRDITNYSGNYGFAKSTVANNGDQVQYQIIVTNNGNGQLTNVTVNDPLPSGLSYVSGTVDNGSYSNGTSQYLGTMYQGQSHTITITAIANGGNGQSIQNIATASANNVPSVSDTAQVTINGGQVLGSSTSFSYSKSAFNDTKNVDATTVPADKEDFITYTLNATNTGSSTANNFVVQDDLTNVLNYASMVDLNGGTLNGNTISWPAVTVAPNTTVKETFRVRVNYTLPSSYNNLQLVNTYGNTVTIQINNPRVLGASITAPTTGPASEAAFALGFGAILTAAFHFIRKGLSARKSV